jgi:hypothetical protein
VKGQLTMQYLASFIFFIGLIVYVYFAYAENIPNYIQEVEKEDLRSKAYQISEVLINDNGHPINWDHLADNQVLRIGLSDETSNKTNLISLDKVNKLEIMCGNTDSEFQKVQNKLAMDKPFIIYVFNISQTDGQRKLLLDCFPSKFPKKVLNATVKRIVALKSSNSIDLAELIIQM